MPYTQQTILLDGSSGNSSTYTSAWALVADYTYLTVSWNTSQAVASRCTLQGINTDGFATTLPGVASIVSVSNLTGMATPGLFSVTAGVRWLRALRSSLDSQAVVILEGKCER